jgi:hypothetical protein
VLGPRLGDAGRQQLAAATRDALEVQHDRARDAEAGRTPKTRHSAVASATASTSVSAAGSLAGCAADGTSPLRKPRALYPGCFRHRACETDCTAAGLPSGSSRGPSPSTNQTRCPSAWGTTRISENRDRPWCHPWSTSRPCSSCGRPRSAAH